MTADTAVPNREWIAYNYCVAFVDLLGQREALRDQGLLIPPQTDEQRKAFREVLRNSIGAIIKLQESAEEMLAPILQQNLDSPRRAALQPEQQLIWDKMLHTRVTTQRWSDGLVSFACLGDKEIKCQVIGIFSIFGLVGSLCLLGLATSHPIRGAIEIAWGVELRPNELYGPAVARAYEIESEIAQYPRIVVGPETIGFLQAHSTNPDQDVFSQTDREFATLCLDMLIRDADGHWILHYLGEKFQFAVTHQQHAELYGKARHFVHEQLLTHQANQNTKLAFRYSHLVQYFDAHPPAVPE
ncbi:MAG: hypothetical protein KGI47_11270 [Betaproteobacteria bacterium]|nr:hypothetical protein [Betaproteobacteria bacterium]MDE2621632.1 hypothetical protein [Betaproteobacteria bacterium]